MSRQQARDGGQAGKFYDGNSVQMCSKWPVIWCLGWGWYCFPLAWLPGHPNKPHQDDSWETLHWRRMVVAALGDRLIFSLVLLHPTMSYFAHWWKHRQQAHFLGEIGEKVVPMLWCRQLWGRIDVDQWLKPLSLHHQPSQYHASVVDASDKEKQGGKLIIIELVSDGVRNNVPRISIHHC